MKISLSGEICSDYDGFQKLIDFAEGAKECQFESLGVDLSEVSWMDANMCAPLGAILYKISRRQNSVNLTGMKPALSEVLSKNGFLTSYGKEKITDTYRTTIEYKRFEPADERYFASYIGTHLRGKGIPAMSPGLLKKFRESIFEIFNNAVIHSQTKFGIFSCGQFFPHRNQLNFSLTDMGLGIRENLKLKTGRDVSAIDAIQWAMEGNNTTKQGAIPGGLGLKLLKEFIAKNEGRIQIISDGGYWEFKGNSITAKSFSARFGGTTVDIEINAADTHSYCLASEAPSGRIF